MKNNMKNIFKTLIACFMLVSLVLTSCDSESEITVNDIDQVNNNREWTNVFGEIDQNQDWSLAASAKAKFEVYSLNASEEYRFHLYTSNPLIDNSSLLLGQATVTTDASGNAKAEFDVDVVKGDNVYYACYIDKENRRSVKAVALIDGEIKAQFGASVTRGSLSSDDIVIPTVESPEEEVMAKYGQAKELEEKDLYIFDDADPNFASVLKISSDKSWNCRFDILSGNDNLARTLYVNGTWELRSGEDQTLGKGGLIVVGSTGKIIAPSGYFINNGSRIVVLPGGVIECGGISFNNSESFDYNAGRIKASSIGVGNRLYNYGVMKANTMDGSGTFINHNQTIITECGDSYNDSNLNIQNACQINVSKDFSCKSLYIGENGYVNIGGNLKMGESWGNRDSEIYMAKNSQLKVAGYVKLIYANIVGPTEGWAICEFGRLGEVEYSTSNVDGVAVVTKGYLINNLKISFDYLYWEPIRYSNNIPYCQEFVYGMMNGRVFDAVYVGDGTEESSWFRHHDIVYRSNAHVGNGNTTLVKKGEAPIDIPESDCGAPAYVSRPGDEIEVNPQCFIIGCEDLGNSADRDFNDIVFSVAHATGSTELIITPLAAGGTLPSNIYYDSQYIGEIHALLGETNTQMMINTNGVITNEGAPVSIPVPADWSFEDNKHKFSVRVLNPNGTVSVVKVPNCGESPFMMVVPNTWQWPTEKTNIEDAYYRFGEWSKNVEVKASWINSRVDGKTVNR